MEDGTGPRGRDAVDFALNLDVTDIPDAVLSNAARLLLDTLGVAAAAEPMEAGRIARETAVCLYGGESKTAVPMLFDGRMVSLAGAAFALGSQIDNLDAHDGYNPVKGHIGCAVVPALCALGALTDLSGRDALAAMVVGYEVAGRAGEALHGTVTDYHTSGAWNALGVVAMAGRIRQHGRTRLRHALGIAEYHGPRSQMMREIATPTMLHDGSGMGAFVGLSAAMMAELGFTGAPAVTVESNPTFWSDLGSRWLTMEQYVKPYPVCRWAHAAMDGAAQLRAEHGLSSDSIARVRINTFEKATKLFEGVPTTTSEAQYSLPYAVAQLLIHGHVGVDQITGSALHDSEATRLIKATDLTVDPGYDLLFPNERWADVTLSLTDGRSLSAPPLTPRGEADAPLSDAELIAKYQAFAAPVLGEARAHRIQKATLGLTSASSLFSDVLAEITSAP